MHFVRWITQDYTLLNGFTLPRWGWAVIIAMLAAAAGLAAWAAVRARSRAREDHEFTQSLIREVRDAQPEATARMRAASQDDQYRARPARVSALAAQPADDGTQMGVHDRAPGWEDFSERLTRAEDALVAASDPAGFQAWLDADWAAYEAEAAGLDAILASGAWASVPWARTRELVPA